jgi:putative oxidoreductase
MTLGLLLLRAVVGLTLAAHGSQKLLGWFGGHGLQGTGGFFENALGFKPGRGYAAMAAVTEIGSGLLLALGFLTPAAAAGVIGVMFVAGAAAHAKNGYFITSGGYEYNVVLATAAAALAFTGPGRLSVDHALGWDLSGVVWGVVAIGFGLVAGACILAGRNRIEEPEDTAEPGDTAEPAVSGGREAGLERSEAQAETQAQTQTQA